MQKKNVSTLAAALLLAATAVPSAHAFDVGGTNGWKFSTDGFINTFATYQTIEKKPTNAGGTLVGGNLQGQGSTSDSERTQNFGVNVGLLPVGIGFNIKAPTTNGLDIAARIGIYPSINSAGGNTNPDFREVNLTVDGSFGQVLAGRAINLFEAKNILTDMSLFGIGVVGPLGSAPTVGHIGYGYLYPLFNSQIRYTTPDLSGFKVAVSANQPYALGAATTTNMPLLQTEISYATTFTGGKAQAWIAGSYERASVPGADKHVQSIGGTGGVEVGVGPADFLVSTYGGKAIGSFLFGLGIRPDGGDSPTSLNGKERDSFGFLAQTTYMLTPEMKLGVNYGQSRSYQAGNDTALNFMKGQAATVAVTYNITKFLQVEGEYTWAQDRWFTGDTQDANIIGLGTFLYW